MNDNKPNEETPEEQPDHEDVVDMLQSLTSLNDIEASSTNNPRDRQWSDTISSDTHSSDHSALLEALPVPWGDSFLLTEKLGGGMTGAFLAHQPSLGQHSYVIKILTNTAPKAIQRFETEAAILGRLHKLGVTKIPFPVYFGWHDGIPYLVMELIAGQTLKQLSDDPTWQPSLTEVLRIIRDTAQTLAAAHRVGVVHRDIKPSNLMLGSDGQVSVIDFGIAKDNQISATATSTGVTPGTQAYMAPEQLAGQQATTRSDIFSLGLVLQELLGRYCTSKPRGYSEAKMLASRMTDRSQDLRTRSCEEVTSELDTVIRSTDPKPWRRQITRTAATMLVLASVTIGWLVANYVSHRNEATTNASSDIVTSPTTTTTGSSLVERRWMRMSKKSAKKQ